MKKVLKSVRVSLDLIWNTRLQLVTEGRRLRTRGNILIFKGDKLRNGSVIKEMGPIMAKGFKLYAEGYKLKAEGDKLWSEGNNLWAEAILKMVGNVTIDWVPSNGSCVLGTGDVFKGV